MEARQMIDAFKNLYNLYLNNTLLVVIIEEIIAFTLFAYFLIHRRKNSFFVFYWKGFLFIGLGITVTLLQILLSFQSWRLNLIKLPFLCIGIFWIVRGIKRQSQEKRKKNEKTRGKKLS
jgi:hypothetical protein